jgi:hypothetical protein
VPEWLKGLAWKAGISQGIEGSNPFLSANKIYGFALGRPFFILWLVNLFAEAKKWKMALIKSVEINTVFSSFVQVFTLVFPSFPYHGI